ncbi:hypothetical protein [Streptodolium elevatio]|uniref:Uncharacterized protein n=1 Tax=Streptodolium elevatio TaxID=3157996 RepID=A0ABV3DHB0_9ACTN
MPYTTTVLGQMETVGRARPAACSADSPLGRALSRAGEGAGAAGGFNSFVSGGFNSFVPKGFNSYVPKGFNSFVSGGFNSYVGKS